MGQLLSFDLLSLSNNQSVFNTKLIDVSMITNVSLLRAQDRGFKAHDVTVTSPLLLLIG